MAKKLLSFTASGFLLAAIVLAASTVRAQNVDERIH